MANNGKEPVKSNAGNIDQPCKLVYKIVLITSLRTPVQRAPQSLYENHGQCVLTPL